MASPSLWSTPVESPLHISVVESSTPFSGSEMKGFQATFGIKEPSYSGSKTTSKAHLRNFALMLWVTALVAGLLRWCLDGGTQSIILEHDFSMSSKQPALEGLQFLDATHPYIRYVGRWTSTPDRTQKDGSFPGIYFDFAFNGSSTVLLSLHNIDPTIAYPMQKAAPALAVLPVTNISHAQPISLLARVDEEDFVILPNASSIVTIRSKSLDRHKHEVRIIAPMIERNTVETLQIEGIWIDEEGDLLPLGFDSMPKTTNTGFSDATTPATPRASHKMLEIVTDLPGSMAGRDKRKSGGKYREILGGVLGWEYLLGDMFAADHTMVGMDSMCLVQECIGGKGSPAGLADVFFQSGPLGSAQYSHPWLFEDYLPNVIVMNIGNSDWESFKVHGDEYNMTLWELSMLFEDTYVSMVRAIRTLAYPKNSHGTSGALPIFIMRPLRGQLDQVTHSVVDRLQLEGDTSVYWLDTSGWLNTDIDLDGPAEEQDFFLDDTSPSKQWRLTERGNQRVAILLHMHVCRYLAREVEKCVFLPAEAYQATADSSEFALRELLEHNTAGNEVRGIRGH